MKKFIFFARVYTWLVVLPLITNAQTPDVFPNYVVIGAFEHKKNAVFFSDDANQHNFPARFEMNPNRNLYYVYVLTTDDRELAFAEALKLRTDTKYFDTWVYAGLLGEDALAKTSTQNFDINPTTGEQIRSVTSDRRQNQDLSSGENVQAPDAAAKNGAKAIASNPSETARNSRKQKENEINNDGASVNPADGISANTPGKTEGEKQNQSTIPRNNGTSGSERSTDGSGDGRSAETALAADPSKNKNDASISGNGKIQSAVTGNTGGENKTTGTALKADDVAEADKIDPDRGSVNTDKKTEAIAIGPPPKRVSTEPLTSEEVTGKNFYFYLFREDNHDMVAGEVDAIDFEKSRRMATYDANTQVKVIMPSGKTKQISFVCQVFGYRKLQKEFDPASPADDMYLDDKGNVVVPFELMRLQKGDIAIMYNVFFFKDAAVMRPESRYEVNNLLELLQENPSYKIRIHGHTNGNAPGKIIYMDKPGNFYSLSNTRQGGGSAKKLSEERALVIREYLISSGISADRMQVEAWGGKKPIHDKNSARAHENVRVEIEILSE
jgi:outer membrane protein OmpA-like peptidoglycan-associated protein